MRLIDDNGDVRKLEDIEAEAIRFALHPLSRADVADGAQARHRPLDALSQDEGDRRRGRHARRGRRLSRAGTAERPRIRENCVEDGLVRGAKGGPLSIHERRRRAAARGIAMSALPRRFALRGRAGRATSLATCRARPSLGGLSGRGAGASGSPPRLPSASTPDGAVAAGADAIRRARPPAAAPSAPPGPVAPDPRAAAAEAAPGREPPDAVRLPPAAAAPPRRPLPGARCRARRSRRRRRQDSPIGAGDWAPRARRSGVLRRARLCAGLARRRWPDARRDPRSPASPAPDEDGLDLAAFALPKDLPADATPERLAEAEVDAVARPSSPMRCRRAASRIVPARISPLITARRPSPIPARRWRRSPPPPTPARRSKASTRRRRATATCATTCRGLRAAAPVAAPTRFPTARASGSACPTRACR